MKTILRNLWRTMVLSYIIVSIVPLFIAASMAVNLIHTQIEEQAEITLDKNLDAVARHFYQRLGHIHFYLNTMSNFLGPELYHEEDYEGLRELLIEIKERDQLSYLTVVSPTGQVTARANSDLKGDQIDRGCEVASFTGSCFKGVAILDCVFLEAENLARQARINNLPEEYLQSNEETRGIALSATVPIFSPEGEVKAYLLGGELLNNNLRMVDEMSENWQGNVTIFLDNLRVATSLRGSSGERITGTVLSSEVEEVVLKQGKRYLGRSTIADIQYLTAYDPIYSVSGNVVGAIFLGITEEPFLQMKRDTIIYFITMAAFGVFLAFLISYFIIRNIRDPLQQITQAMRRVQSGDFSHRLKR